MKNKSIYETTDLNHVKSITPNINAKEPLRNEIEHFIDCVRNDKKPLTDIEHSYQITEWLDIISRELKLKGYKN